MAGCQMVCARCGQRMRTISIGVIVKIGDRKFISGDMIDCPQCGSCVVHIDEGTKAYLAELDHDGDVEMRGEW